LLSSSCHSHYSAGCTSPGHCRLKSRGKNRRTFSVRRLGAALCGIHSIFRAHAGQVCLLAVLACHCAYHLGICYFLVHISLRAATQLRCVVHIPNPSGIVTLCDVLSLHITFWQGYIVVRCGAHISPQHCHQVVMQKLRQNAQLQPGSGLVK
jgi:hypothetical protein